MDGLCMAVFVEMQELTLPSPPSLHIGQSAHPEGS